MWQPRRNGQFPLLCVWHSMSQRQFHWPETLRRGGAPPSAGFGVRQKYARRRLVGLKQLREMVVETMALMLLLLLLPWRIALRMIGPASQSQLQPRPRPAM